MSVAFARQRATETLRFPLNPTQIIRSYNFLLIPLLNDKLKELKWEPSTPLLLKNNNWKVYRASALFANCSFLGPPIHCSSTAAFSINSPSSLLNESRSMIRIINGDHLVVLCCSLLCFDHRLTSRSLIKKRSVHLRTRSSDGRQQQLKREKSADDEDNAQTGDYVAAIWK